MTNLVNVSTKKWVLLILDLTKKAVIHTLPYGLKKQVRQINKDPINGYDKQY